MMLTFNTPLKPEVIQNRWKEIFHSTGAVLTYVGTDEKGTTIVTVVPTRDNISDIFKRMSDMEISEATTALKSAS